MFEIIKQEKFSQQLENEFNVKFINQSSSTLHSNQFLNQILNQIENKIMNQIDYKQGKEFKSFITDKLIEKYYSSYSILEVKQVIEALKLDHIFWAYIEPIQFEEILQKNINNLDGNLSTGNLIKEIESESRLYKFNTLKRKSLILIKKIFEFFEGMKEPPNQTFVDQFNEKYHFEEQFMNISELSKFNYEVKNQRRSSIVIKIQEIENYRGLILETPLETSKNYEENQIFQSNQKQEIKSFQKHEKTDFYQTNKTIFLINKNLREINQKKKLRCNQSIDIYSIPIFNYLYTKHQKQRCTRSMEALNRCTNDDFGNSLKKRKKKCILEKQSNQQLQQLIQSQPKNFAMIDRSKPQYFLQLAETYPKKKNNNFKNNALTFQTKKMNDAPVETRPSTSSVTNWTSKCANFTSKFSSIKSNTQYTKFNDSNNRLVDD